MELKHHQKSKSHHPASLLIVPYGIETLSEYGKLSMHDAFNRTLWN